MSKDLISRMLIYEKQNTKNKLIPLLPVIIRLDGKAFHTFTKDLKRPFDIDLYKLMIETTKFLVKETNAIVGYVQSDEISLILHSDSIKSSIFFEGKLYKLLSVIPSMTTAFFNKNLEKYLYHKKEELAFFDCRVFNVPNKIEAINYLIWREMDATRNSISMAAQTYYKRKELYLKNSKEKKEMLFSKGINWDNYPSYFKRGVYVKKCLISKKFTKEEIDKLPPKHHAKIDNKFFFTRSEINVLDWSLVKAIKNTNIEALIMTVFSKN